MNKRFSPRQRKIGGAVALGLFGLIALAMLIDTVYFLARHNLPRDTLLSWGFGQQIDDARVTVDSCTTSGRRVNPRRSASYLVYETECQLTIYLPARAPHRHIERSPVRLSTPDDGKKVLGAGQLLGSLGARWPDDVLWRMWREVPNLLFIALLTLAGAVVFCVWRWRRWWWHDRFRRRKRF